MAKTALGNILEAVYRENAQNCDPKTVQWASRDDFRVEKYIHNHLTAEMTQEDPDIQILLDHAKDLYSSLLGAKWG
ncbi:hypothetical protein DPMN_145313 [Dreissena polymorpha]|uniref:Uncharacterized protein n=1 Tax=Dreissena polymorpha TaxID=45954 RepID=A0A9D4J132_DREPO|nr:hypothetical protein DPMN_145313 [Dreissena polymorpha]